MADNGSIQAERDRLKSDLVKLRQTMASVLTAIGGLVKPILALDTDLFGGRHQTSYGDPTGPVDELALATRVVESLSERMHAGGGTPASGDDLRLALGDLADACGDLREQTNKLEQVAVEGIGLPANKAVPLEAPQFDFNEPMDSVHSAADFLSSIEAVLGRTVGRIHGLVQMVASADDERSRAETELSELQTSPALIAETARKEVVALQSELNAMRLAMRELQELSVDRELHSELEDDLAELRSRLEEDTAEVRSFLGELQRIADAQVESEANDLTYALEDLRAALDADEYLAPMATAGERVLVVLGDLIEGKLAAASATPIPAGASVEESAAAEEALRKSRLAAEELQAELDATRGQLESAREQLRLHESSQGNASEELGRLRQQVSDQERQAGEAAGRSESELTELRRQYRDSEDQLGTLRQTLDEVLAERDQFQARSEEAGASLKDITAARDEMAQRFRECEDALRTARQEATRATEQRDDLQSRVEQLDHERADLDQRFQTLREELDEVRSDLESERRQRGEAETLRTRLANELEEVQLARDATAGELDEALRQARQEALDLKQRLQRTEQTLDEREQVLRQQEADERERITALQSEQRSLQQRAEDLQRQVTELRSERSDLQDKVDDLGQRQRTGEGRNQQMAKDLAEARRLLTAAEEDREKFQATAVEQVLTAETATEQAQEQLAKREGELGQALAEARSEAESLRSSLSTAETRINELTSQAAAERQLREEVSSLREQLGKAERDLPAALAQRDAADETIAELKKEVGELQSRVDSAEDQARTAQRERDAIVAERDEAQAQAAARREELDSARSQTAGAEGVAKEASQRIEDLEAQSKRQRARLEELEATVAQRESTIAEAQAESRELREQLHQREAEAGRQQTRAEDAERKLGDLGGKHSETRALTEGLQGELEQERQARRELLAKTESNAKRELASTKQMYESQIKHLKGLLRSARDEVKQAITMLERRDEEDRQIIADLLGRIRELENQQQE